MPKLSTQDYERIASEVSKDYFTKQIPLSENILKYANDLGLNPDQIDQIVWQANTKVHLELFEKRAEDKVIEFPLADSKYIVSELYKESALTTTPKKPHESVDMITDFYNDLPRPTEKEAASNFVENVTKNANVQHTQNVMLIRKLASELEMCMLEAREDYRVAIKDLNGEVRKIASDPRSDRFTLADFEWDAVSLYGEDIKPILKDAGLKEHEKFADNYKFAEVIDIDGVLFDSLITAKTAFDNSIKFARGLQYIKKTAGHIL